MNQYFKSRISSFGFALKGVKFVLLTQPNFIIHLTAGVAVNLLGWYFRISNAEWGLIWLCIGMVLSAEAFNTALEKFVDLVEPAHNPKAGLVKDIAAGAVLFTAVASLIVGLVIFIPKF